MPKPNYGHVKRQKEAQRKLRQQKKLDRRQTRPEESTPETPASPAGNPDGTVTP
jgi:hypothetical protein